MHIPTAPRKAPLPGALRRMGAYLSSRHFANAPAILFSFFRLPGPPATEGTPPCPRGYGHPLSPFHHVQIRPRRNLFYTCFIFTADLRIFPPIPPSIFLLRTEAHPLNPPTRDRRPCPSIRTTSDRKPTSIVSTFSSLHSCARSSSTSSSPKTSTTASRRPSTCRSSSSRGSPSSISGGRDTS